MMFLQTRSREQVVLDGTWGFMPDPMGAFGPAKRSRSVFQGLDPVKEDRAVEYDINAMLDIQVPGDWNTQNPEWLNLEEAGWYTLNRTFSESEWSQLQGQRNFLCFESVNYSLRLWINGHEVADTQCPFLPQAFDITEHLKQTTLICVRVDARRDAQRMPSKVYDWWNYGGIFGSVSICPCPETVLADCHFTVDQLDDQGVRGAITVDVDGPAAQGFSVEVSVPELGLSWTGQGADGVARMSYTIDPEAGVVPWSCENPKLYDYRVTITTPEGKQDQLDLRVGFRHIVCKGKEIFLNGKSLFLKGIAWHDERFGELGGRTRNREDCAELVSVAKELGSNFARLAHYPHSEHTLDLCDELGLLVWDEIPVYWAIEYDTPVTREIGDTMWRQMLLRDRQHPCVLVHAVANETYDAPGKPEFMQGLKQVAEELNPGIPLGAAIAVPFVDGEYTLFDRPDMLVEFSDVIGINEYGGWYSPPLDKMPTARVTGHPDKPTFISEFGASGPSGVHGPSDQLWNEDNQLEVYKQQFAMFERCIDSLCGVSPWVMKDFRSPLRQNGFQRQFNTKGIVSAVGKQKMTFHFVQDQYNESSQGLVGRVVGKSADQSSM